MRLILLQRTVISLGAVACGLFGTVRLAPTLAQYLVPRAHPRPVTITETVKYENSDALEVSRDRRIVALRSDGSESTTTTPVDAADREHRDIVDVTAARTTLIDSFTQSNVTVALAPASLRHYRQKWSGGCRPFAAQLAKPSSHDQSTLLGYNVMKITRRAALSTPGDILVEESWIAPDLYCYALRTIASKVHLDRLVARTLYEVTSVNFGEPDSALFKIPEHYTKRTPSEIYAEYDKKLGKPGGCDANKVKGSNSSGRNSQQ